MKTMRTYSELITIPDFKERFLYLKLDGKVGEETFGYDRYLNQIFYRSPEWKRVRREVIIRDLGCDLGIEDRPLGSRIYVHHINPIKLKDISNRNLEILDPEFLICCSYDTHQAIHYGSEYLLLADPVERKPFDTCPWRT